MSLLTWTAEMQREFDLETGRREGLEQGLEQGRVQALSGLVSSGTIDEAQAAEAAGMDVERFRELARKYAATAAE